MDLLEMYYNGTLATWQQSGLSKYMESGAPHISLHYNGELSLVTLYHEDHCELLEFSVYGELRKFCSKHFMLFFERGHLTGAGESKSIPIKGHLLHGEFKDFRYSERGYSTDWYRDGLDITEQVEQLLTEGQKLTEQERAQIRSKFGI